MEDGQAALTIHIEFEARRGIHIRVIGRPKPADGTPQTRSPILSESVKLIDERTNEVYIPSIVRKANYAKRWGMTGHERDIEPSLW